VDPVNGAAGEQYYAYITGGSWELNASMEAKKNILIGNSDKVSTDGGDDFTKYEVGNDLVLAPWSFEFSAFPLASNNSRMPGWYRYNGSAVITPSSDGTSPHFIEVSGYAWYIWQKNIPFDPNSTYEMSCTARQITDPTIGDKRIYCGWTGVRTDETTLANSSGSNTYSSQHYHASSGSQLTAGAGWHTFTGYTRGWGSPNGYGSSRPNPDSPGAMHESVRYIRPLFIMNYSGGNGVAHMDSIVIKKY
jgi:hypothetical protein